MTYSRSNHTLVKKLVVLLLLVLLFVLTVDVWPALSGAAFMATLIGFFGVVFKKA